MRLGPDRVRRAHLASIYKEVDAACVGQCKGFEFPRLTANAPPSIAVGNAIDLADGVRIFEQYAKIISNSCHCKDHSACAHPTGSVLFGEGLPTQLAWFESLREPVQARAGLQPTFDRLVSLFRDVRGEARVGAPTSTELYELQQTLPHVDLEMIRLMLATGRPSAPAYEAHISAQLLRLQPQLTWLGHMDALDGWRDRGLLHPLLLAAAYMPILNDWLPVELHEQCPRWGDALTALNAARTPDEIRAAVASVETAVDWEGAAGLGIASVLDRLAIAMRLLSNAPAGEEAHLDKALASFPDWTDKGASLGRIWKQARHALESCLPPSLLCPPLAGFRKATWGYHALTPVVEGEALRFAERCLEWVEPQPDQAHAVDALDASGKKQGLARIQDVLCRMGVIALSPEIGHLMMLAREATDHLTTGASSVEPHHQSFCRTPTLLLHFMSDPALLSDDGDVQRAIDQLFASLPSVTRIEAPVRLAGWRVDPPARIVLRTGHDSSVLLDERSDAPSVGGIIALPQKPPVDPHADHAFRARLVDDILARLRGPLRQPLAESVRLDAGRQHTHTALHEGLATMALHEPVLHTFVPLHQTTRWENDSQDARYSESQLAANGQRFRDWLAVHRDPRTPQKCRLDSHAVLAQHYFGTLFPWRRGDGSTEWVSVAASVEPQVRVLQERRTPAGTTVARTDRHAALLSSVKGRFMQDLKLLPVRDPAHRIERRNTTVYDDRQRGQVLICYAPTGDPDTRIEFLAFGLRG